MALGLEGVDNTGHGRGADLLGVGELAEGDGAGEDDDGESGKPGGIEAAGRVDATQFAEQMDGGGVERLGSCFGVDALSG
jgi:hypothetical protein